MLTIRWKRAAAFATDRLYTAPRRYFAASMTDIGVQGWSYRWDEAELPNFPAELGGKSVLPIPTAEADVQRSMGLIRFSCWVSR